MTTTAALITFAILAGLGCAFMGVGVWGACRPVRNEEFETPWGEVCAPPNAKGEEA